MKFKRPQGARWGVKALAESEELHLVMYDEIGGDFWGEGITSRDVVAALAGAPDAKTIRVSINSPGGDAFEGIAIHTALAKHPAKVIVEVDALAASAASLIAMAGDEIHMAPGAMFMIHGGSTWTHGNAALHAARAKMLEQINESYLGIYAAKSSLDRDAVADIMAAETWFTAKEAKAAGFATHLSAAEVEPKTRALANDFLAQMQSPTARRLAAPVVAAAATKSPPPSSEGHNPGELDMSAKLFIKLGVESEADALAAVDESTKFLGAVMAATGTATAGAALDRLTALAALSQIETLADATGDELVGKVAALKDAAEKLPEAQAKLADIEAKASAEKLSALVDGALEKGKVTKARADWLREQPVAVVQSFLAVAGDGVPGSNGKAAASAPPDAIHMTDEDRALARGFGMTDEQWIAAKREADGLPPVVSDDDEGEA